MPEENTSKEIKRRAFFKRIGLGTLASTALVGLSEAHSDHHKVAEPAASDLAPTALPAGYTFFTPWESDFVEASVDTLIPTDDAGPGALEVGVAVYIDRQMAGAFGQGARFYLQGPFAKGEPQQGWQVSMTPSELVRVGISEMEKDLSKRHGKSFKQLSSAVRIEEMQKLEAGMIPFESIPSRLFFDEFYNLTMEGYFGDPIYGGNRGKASWKMIGFPGVLGNYSEDIEKFRGRPYPVDPKSIQDFS